MSGPVCRFCGRPAKVADRTIGAAPLYDCGEWCTSESPPWEYGFYDSEDARRTIYWHVFGILKHETPESAEHTGRKSCWGHPVIVRRRAGADEWEHYGPNDPEET